MRNEFLRQLDDLNQQLIAMGGMIELAVERAFAAFESGEANGAKEAFELEIKINQSENNIETICMDLLLMEQPVASDLRKVSAAMKMVTDMERMGDQAADIAEISLSRSNRLPNFPSLHNMAKEVIIMIKRSIDAFVKQDIALAQGVIDHDDLVDRYFLDVRAELICGLRENPNYAEQGVDTIMVSKYLERIADHATNIAEWVIFVVTGNHPKQTS